MDKPKGSVCDRCHYEISRCKRKCVLVICSTCNKKYYILPNKKTVCPRGCQYQGVKEKEGNVE